MAIHKTTNGTELDMDTLRLKNEAVRAVGNMNVNARGDVLDSENKVTASRSKQVNSHYRKQASSVRDIPVRNNKSQAADALAKSAKEDLAGLSNSEAPAASDVNMDAIIEKLEENKEADKVETGGLAGAIAKAREVNQEPVKTQAEEERSITGVKKI